MHEIFGCVGICLLSPRVVVLCPEARVFDLVIGGWQGRGGDNTGGALRSGDPFTIEHTSTAIVTRRTAATIMIRKNAKPSIFMSNGCSLAD